MTILTPSNEKEINAIAFRLAQKLVPIDHSMTDEIRIITEALTEAFTIGYNEGFAEGDSYGYHAAYEEHSGL